MKFIRAEGIPIWVTIIMGLVGVMGTTFGIMAMIDPTAAIGFIDGADSLAIAWGGRNAGLGVALLLAVYLRNSGAYAAAIGGSLFREISDLIANGFPLWIMIFLVIEIVCFVISLRATLKAR